MRVRIHRLLLAETVLALRWPGAVGAVLLVAGGALAGLLLLPGRDELAATDARLARIDRRAAAVRNGVTTPQVDAGIRRAQFYGALPAQAELMQQVGRIYQAAADEHLSLDRGEYTGAEVAGTGLVRHRIALPVKGRYAQVQRFIAASQSAVPGLVLDSLSLQRRHIADEQVEANVHLSLFLVTP